MHISFSMLAGALPNLDTRRSVDEKLADLQDYQLQLLEYLRYALSNLGEDNFNSTGLETILSPIRAELKAADGKVSALALTAEGLSATVQNLSGDLGQVRSTVSQTAESLSAVVSAVGKNGAVSAASIVAAINNAGSSVKLSADRVDLRGLVTVSSLQNKGETVIHGGNITTGEIRAVNFIATGETAMEVENPDGTTIGTVSYTYEEADDLLGDKLWLTTHAYWGDLGKHYPSIKLESAGGVSAQAGNGPVYLSSRDYITLDGGDIHLYDGSGVHWEFSGGNLYKDGNFVA